MSTMRAMAASEIGDIGALAAIELPIPEPRAGEVRVRVAWSAVNPADTKVLRGELAGRFIHARSLPLVTGWDLSGTVDAVGEGVADLRTGDEVWGHLPYAGTTTQGAFAEQVTIAASQVAKKPAAIGHDVAAAAATPGMTALQGLRDVGRLAAGQRVMVMGAAGGVGSLAVGIGKRLGATVVGVCSTSTCALVEELGADEVVDRTKTDPLRHRPLVDLVFDTPDAYSFGACTRVLVAGGTYLTTLPSPRFLAGKLRALFSSRRCAVLVVASRRADLEQLGEWIAGGLRVAIEARYPVKDVATAIRRIAAGGRTGRIVVDVAGGW